jgi:hypothetical protein
MGILRGIDHMANHDTIVSSDKLSAIADAIRDKTGKSDTLTLDQMPEEIESISGGGATPTCGIVPTSWSPNGFVLSANSYGDIASYAFAGDERVMHGYNPTTDSITTDPSESSLYYRSPIYDYLRRVQFMTVPSIIGDYAFKHCRWLNITSLPEGVETIGAEAFSYCSSSQITEIPSTVKLIHSLAFLYIRDYSNMSADYDSHTAYSIGDIVLDPSGYEVTCVVNIPIPEDYNENHWVPGRYPQISGVYDPDISYSTGDVVVNAGNIYTCLFHHMPTQYEEGYYPEIIGIYSPTHTYHAGDTVLYRNYYNYLEPYTCLVDNPSDIPSSDWMSGYYPNILGLYTPGANYDVGDMVIYNYYPYTCRVPISDAGSFDYAYWISGQYPQLLGIYDPSVTYHLGDVVCIDSGYGSYIIYTCIVSSSSTSDQFDQEWYREYCPTVLGQFGGQPTYAIGDVVIYDSSLYTCKNATSGDDFVYDDWISGYYPEAVSQSSAINVGDVCILYSSGSDYPCTVYQVAGDTTTLIPGDYPTLKEEYDATHRYSAGDLVVQFSSDYSSSSMYLNISHIPVIADLDDSNCWESISSDYYGRTLTFLGTPDYIDDTAISSDSYEMLLFPFGIRDVYYGSEHRCIYLYNRVCTGYRIIAPDVLAIGTDNSVKFLHNTSTDLSQTNWGNEYSVSAENATISWSDSTHTYTVTPDSGLTSGDTVSITVTSDEDSSLSTTFTIPVDSPVISFDPLSSSWHTDGDYSGHTVYSCTRSADNTICEFTLCGHAKLQVYYRFVREQSYNSLPMYLGNIDSSVSESSYNSTITVSNSNWQGYCYMEYDIAGQVADIWESHTMQILLPKHENSRYYNTLQIYIVGVA